MRLSRLTPVVCLASALLAGAADTTAPAHDMKQDKDLVWGPAPAALPAGAQMAVLAGNPGEPGPFTVRAKMPDGYKVPPHWHPTDENVTVLSGTFLMGMGDTMDPGSMTTLTAGGFARMPATMHHYAMAKGPTVIQVHGTGPFTLTYVNPADDPRPPATK